MRIHCIGNGLYEVYDGVLGRDGVPYAVYVLDDGSCTCDLFMSRLAKWKANPDPTKEARVWCVHLEAAARHYNNNLRVAGFGDLPVPSYQKEAWRNAGRDLQQMLDDMNEQENDK